MVFIGILAAFVFYYAFALRYIYRYQLGESGIEGRWFGIRTLYVPYSNVEEVEVISFRESLDYGMRTVRAGNRFGGPVVVVKRRSSWFRNTVLLTPDDSQLFAGELRRRVEAAGQPGTADNR